MKAITVLEATAEDAEVSTVPASLGPYVQYYPPRNVRTYAEVTSYVIYDRAQRYLCENSGDILC